MTEPFAFFFNNSPSIDEIMIYYAYLYKSSSDPIMKGGRAEIIKIIRKEYKQRLE